MTNSLARCSRLLLVVALGSQLALPALADSSVRVAGVPVISVLVPSGGMTPDQRARTMQKNLDNAIVASTNKSPTAVGVSLVNGQPVVTFGGFYVCSVDAASAKKSGLTPMALANKWAGGIRTAVRNPSAVNSYIAKLTGSGSLHSQPGTTTTAAGSYPFYKQGRIVYIPAGMTLPVSINTALSSASARPGDPVEARLAEDLNLGDTTIPANSVLLGRITDAAPGQRMSKAGTLGLKFTKLRTPDGAETPISAHIIGGLENFDEQGSTSDVYRGEGGRVKLKDAALKGAIGAGAGALLGTTIGAISSRGYGTGRGAIAGTVIGGAIGVGESLLWRKGHDVNVASGQTLKLQLDAPASIGLSGGSF